VPSAYLVLAGETLRGRVFGVAATCLLFAPIFFYRWFFNRRARPLQIGALLIFVSCALMGVLAWVAPSGRTSAGT